MIEVVEIVKKKQGSSVDSQDSSFSGELGLFVEALNFYQSTFQLPLEEALAEVYHYCVNCDGYLSVDSFVTAKATLCPTAKISFPLEGGQVFF